MWKLKSISKVSAERKVRIKKARNYLIVFVFIFSWYVLQHYLTIEHVVTSFKANPSLFILIIISPVLVFSLYRSYIKYGTWGEYSTRVCVGCSKTWNGSYDGWGFMSFGNKKAKWYQFKVCNTPEKCKIVHNYQVEWVDDEKI